MIEKSHDTESLMTQIRQMHGTNIVAESAMTRIENVVNANASDLRYEAINTRYHNST